MDGFHVSHPDFRLTAMAQFVREGGVVACPAEAVWGLSCNPFSDVAVSTLLAMKQRPASKGLIIVAAEEWMLEPVLCGLSAIHRKTLSLSWPGPNTWLVPNCGVFPYWITGDSDEVAVRITSSPSLAALSRAAGGPLVSTSANPAGANPARWGFQVARYFGAALPRAAGQVSLRGKPSTIRRVATGEVIRA